jgi:hypothetical protein
MTEGDAWLMTKGFKDSNDRRPRHDPKSMADHGEHSAGTAETTTEARADTRPRIAGALPGYAATLREVDLRVLHGSAE